MEVLPQGHGGGAGDGWASWANQQEGLKTASKLAPEVGVDLVVGWVGVRVRSHPWWLYPPLGLPASVLTSSSLFDHLSLFYVHFM